MKKFRHIILALTALILASCAVDEFWEGMDHAEGEEVVMTFKPRFEDFESVTKAIGDGSQVNQLLVHVYEDGSDKFEAKTYNITDCQVQEEVKIPFYYGKKYKVYFWAYKSGNDSPYTVSNIGLKGGVSVNYPANELGYDALESLDAFYAVSDVDLSNGRTMDINLTRPFAQVNLVAKKNDLAAAQATKVEFTINVAEKFNLTSPISEGTTPKTFTFTSTDYFQSTEKLNQNTEELNQNTEELNVDVYLGTTYLFVPSSGEVTGTVKLYAGDNVLKSAEKIKIPLVGNKRTNLVFSGFQVIVPDWNPGKQTVPGPSGGWITITEPEQLAALLMAGTTEGTKVKIGQPLNMEKMPESLYAEILGKSFDGLTLDGKDFTIKNYKAPAFFAKATNLTVSNLTLENVKISAATHVGVLVNELHGNGTFTNVTVKGSSATTTNGAAGGFVGRSVRIDEKGRKETLALTFTGCRIEGTDDKKIVATGSAAEGKFVGLFSGYDNGEKLVFTNCTSENANVADYKSRYVEGNEGAWLADTDFEAYNSWLGDEAYYRGVVTFGDVRFQPKWDGKTSVEPIFQDTSKKEAQIWSAFDLAYLQDKTLTTILFKSDVDMGGVCEECKHGKGNSTIANDDLSTCSHCIPFNQIVTINNLYGENHTLYNLFIQGIHLVGSSNRGMGFIRYTSKGEYKDLTFDGAVIKCIDDINYRDDDQKGGNGYAGTLTSKVEGKMTISNVHARNGHVMGISKMGGMIGYVSGGIDATNCSVEYYTIENHRINVVNSYSVSIEKEFAGQKIKAECAETFYTEGEAGGFIGFISSNSTISDCHTSNITMKTYGCDDKTAKIKCYTWQRKYIIYGSYQWVHLLDLDYVIAGRHCNAFIGDIRTPDSNEITISECYTSNNTYVSGYDHDYYGQNGYSSTNNNELVGCVYFVGKDVEIAGKSMHAGDYKGTVTINGQSMPFIGG